MANRFVFVLVLLCAVTIVPPAAFAQTVCPSCPAPLRTTTARDWLIKTVCADASDLLVLADPYPNCPAGSHPRAIKVGEGLPYRNHDQPQPSYPHGYLYKDNYPVLDSAGNQEFLSTVSWIDGPTKGYKPGRDGFDLMTVRAGWVSDLETHSSAELSTVAFGAGCVQYNAFGFLPLDKPLSYGRAMLPIFPDHWEQLGEPFPGKCDATRFTTNVLTTWRFEQGYKFGGIDGAPVKIMDTLIGTMGWSTDPSFLKKGHIETFYFTKLYGLTRWEGWTPSVQTVAPGATNNCTGPATMTYESIPFTLSDCRDYSATDVATALTPLPPWPASNLNLLQNFHFGDGLAHWSTTGSGMNRLVSVQKSLLSGDIFEVPYSTGLNYMQIDTRSGLISHGTVYQDLPATSVPAGQYSMGIIARSNVGNASVILSLQEIAADGSLIVAHSTPFTLTPVDTTGHFNGSTSKARASNFDTAEATIDTDLRTTVIRFVIAPQSASQVEVISAWLEHNPQN